MKRHIPNTITCLNLVSGCIAVVCALRGDYHAAVVFIILGATFDFFDGMSARLLRVSSPIGKELDSLADDVTFGVAPSAILFSLLGELTTNTCLPYVAFTMAAFSALRLAKFNLDERQATSFIGLPTPANALFWGSLVVGLHDEIVALPYALPLLIAGLLAMSVLLVCELPLFALKFKDLSWAHNKQRFIFLLGCLPCACLGLSAFAAIIVWYILCNLIKAPRA